MFHRVNAKAINYWIVLAVCFKDKKKSRERIKHTGVIGDEILHPVIPYSPHSSLRGVEIGQRDSRITQPTVFHISLIVVVCNQAVGMEIARGIEWIEDAVVNGVASSIVSLS